MSINSNQSKYMTGEGQYKIALLVACPWMGNKQSPKCNAKAGERCHTVGPFPQYPHSSRFDLACNTLTEEPVEESWHYRRECAHCGFRWMGLHCPHERSQNPCPNCGIKPAIVNADCICEFEPDWKTVEGVVSLPKKIEE